MLQAEPEKLFVFGDNFQRRGFGGQAKEMRGEPNAVGIPTKRFPSMAEESFLTDNLLTLWGVNSGAAIIKLLGFEGVIVWPAAGIGTGLAELEKRAPRIWRAIQKLQVGLASSGDAVVVELLPKE